MYNQSIAQTVQQPSVNQHTAQLLKDIRNEKGWSQLDVYACTTINLSRVDSGKANITLLTIKELCDFYDVNIKTFFDRLHESLATTDEIIEVDKR